MTTLKAGLLSCDVLVLTNEERFSVARAYIATYQGGDGALANTGISCVAVVLTSCQARGNVVMFDVPASVRVFNLAVDGIFLDFAGVTLPWRGNAVLRP